MDFRENKENAEDDARYETFVARFAHYEPDLRRFIRSLLPTAVDTDEVIQQTAIVIWRKFDQYDPKTNFMKWACVIARFEALAYRRKMARDRLVFREDVMELMADEGAEELIPAPPKERRFRFASPTFQRSTVIFSHSHTHRE